MFWSQSDLCHLYQHFDLTKMWLGWKYSLWSQCSENQTHICFSVSSLYCHLAQRPKLQTKASQESLFSPITHTVCGLLGPTTSVLLQPEIFLRFQLKNTTLKELIMLSFLFQVASVTVIHVPDDKYGLSARLVFQYLLTSQGNMYELKVCHILVQAGCSCFSLKLTLSGAPYVV